jgi:hypothetical protein
MQKPHLVIRAGAYLSLLGDWNAAQGIDSTLTARLS